MWRNCQKVLMTPQTHTATSWWSMEGSEQCPCHSELAVQGNSGSEAWMCSQRGSQIRWTGCPSQAGGSEDKVTGDEVRKTQPLWGAWGFWPEGRATAPVGQVVWHRWGRAPGQGQLQQRCGGTEGSWFSRDLGQVTWVFWASVSSCKSEVNYNPQSEVFWGLDEKVGAKHLAQFLEHSHVQYKCFE